MEWISWLVDTAPFVARMVCGTGWEDDPWLVTLTRASDLTIFASYVASPPAIILLHLRMKTGWRPWSPRLGWALTSLFILTCGATHLMEFLMFTWPAYRLEALVKAVCAFFSVGFVLWFLLESMWVEKKKAG